jgi:hypothetical protein
VVDPVVPSAAFFEHPNIRVSFYCAGLNAERRPALITNAKGASQSVEPQTVAQALAALKGMPEFGDGALTTKGGTLLAPDTRLQPGGEYIFVPRTPSGRFLR